MTAAARLRVQGAVQGVGFRPFVRRLASELALGGYVLNDEHGVLVEVEGDEHAVARFVERLPLEAPRLAHIERVASERVVPCGVRAFSIAPSANAGEPDPAVALDAATCDECLTELFDPSDRRHRYPFISCTTCGPSITAASDDGPLTAIAGSEMCALCAAEHDDPSNRRFHAHANACAACGPSLHLADRAGRPLELRDHALVRACAALRGGAIVAMNGPGGYRVACRADHERTVALLRSRKHDEDTPFAVMATCIAEASALVHLEPDDEAALSGPRRPVAVAPRVSGANVAAVVAPGTDELGVMLPHTPIHHLLMRGCGGPLIMTGGDVPGEPAAYEEDDARDRLARVADFFLVNERARGRSRPAVDRRMPDAVRRRPRPRSA